MGNRCAFFSCSLIEVKWSAMRVLITISPQMYRQALALAVLNHRPDDEVLLASPEELDAQTKRFAPHALVQNHDGEDLSIPEGVVCWVGVLVNDSMNATIAVDGRFSDVHDVTIDGLLSALEEAATLIGSTEGGVR